MNPYVRLRLASLSAVFNCPRRTRHPFRRRPPPLMLCAAPPLRPLAVLKNIALSWGVTLPVSAAISVAFYLLCQPLLPPVVVATVASRLAALPKVG